MDDKTLMETAAKLEKEELLKLIGFMVNVSETAKQVMVEFCRKDNAVENHQEMEQQLRQSWRKAQPVVEMFNTCGGGAKSEEDDVRDELNKMKELLKKSEFSWEVRKEILDEVLEEVASDNSGLTDVLVDLASRMCKAKDEKIYLADFLAAYGNSFYKNYAAEIYLEEYGKEEEHLKEKKAKPVNSSDYIALANQYKKQGNEELALKTVLEGLEKAEGRLYEIYGYLFTYYAKRKDEKALEELYKKSSDKKQDKDFLTELLFGHYKEQGNYVKEKEMLFDLMDCADSKKLVKWYHICQKELSAEDFAAEEKNLLKALKERNLSAYFDICIEKGNVSEVLEYLTGRKQFKEGNADAGHRLSKQLAQMYPREIVKTYWEEVNFYIQFGGQEDCRYAVNVLREIHEIMEQNSWTDEWNDKYNDFIRDSISNPVLIGELANF